MKKLFNIFSFCNTKRIKALEENVKIIELAFAEFIKINCEEQAVEVTTIYSQYSAVSQMFANMIKKGIYTIDKVPARYREEVLEVLKIKQK